MSKRARRSVEAKGSALITSARPQSPGRAAPVRPREDGVGVVALLRRLGAALRSEVWAAPLSIFAGSRLALFALALLLPGLLPVDPTRKPGFLGAFGAWDGGWYTSIAATGYEWRGAGAQSNLAFFPLYPFLGKIVGFLFGGPQAGLFLVANLSFAVCLVYLYRLACLDFTEGVGRRAILYLALFPLSFVFSSMYTESTMLALTVAAFYYARRGKWQAAIPLGALASLTRLAGVLILLPLAWEYYKQRGLRRQALWLAAIPAGTAAWGLYVWRLTGSPLSVLTVTGQAWSRRFTLPWDTVRIALDVVTHNPLPNYITAIAIFDTATILLFLTASFLAIKYLPVPYWLYAVPSALMAISSTLDPTQGLPTASLARYLLAVFPVFIMLGLAGRNRYVHQVAVFSSALLFGILPVYFFSGIWVC